MQAGLKDEQYRPSWDEDFSSATVEDTLNRDFLHSESDIILLERHIKVVFEAVQKEIVVFFFRKQGFILGQEAQLVNFLEFDIHRNTTKA